MAAEQYTTDVTYPSAFGAFQAPIHLAQVAWSAGLATCPVDRPFTYLDLGCGGGLTLCVLAACYPDAEFHGVDLNPAHVAEGRALAAIAELSNVEFHEASFADLATLPIPEVDFAGLSGVYSWLPTSLRHACLAFLAEKLSPAGAVFLHYAALPGNAQIDALYSLLREVARGVPGDSLVRYEAARAIMGRVRSTGARFFKLNPQADAWLLQLDRHEPRAMAHEILNAQSTSLSARDVENEARLHGLRFVANAQLELNDADLSSPDSLRADLLVLEPTAREMILDAVRNTHSRMDVLMRIEADAAEAQAPDLWVGRLTRGPLIEERRALGARLGLDLLAEPYNTLLAALDGESARIRVLAKDGLQTLALKRLLALKLVQATRLPFVRKVTARRTLSPLNTLVLADRIESSGPVPFASPVAGSQVLLPPQDRLALMALVGGDFTAAWKRMAAAGQRAKVSGRYIDGPAALEAAAQERAAALGPQLIESLVGLGILI